MITYRSFKKLLGETSLERKCRYLFGAALLGLITGSFWLQAARTRQVVHNQQVISAQTLVSRLVTQRHYSRYGEQLQRRQNAAAVAAPAAEPTSPRAFSTFEESLRESEDTGTAIQWYLSPLDDQAIDEGDSTARRRLGEDGVGGFSVIQSPEAPGLPRTLTHYAAVRATAECLSCHTADNEYDAAEYQQDEFVAVAAVTLPLDAVDEELSLSHAIFIGSAILTTGLAMLSAWIIVRYIIVKPVVHLKDVSDAIAMGNLTQRAEITTGDEFEELSHAFNRMLRHMTTVNAELRAVNDNLDTKVDALAQANMELFNSNKLKDDFLATVSHELRTPLNSILGFSDILASAANLDDRQKRYVDNIQTSGRNLMTQINDLLDLAKIESGQMEIQAGSVDLQELIDVLVQQVNPLAEQKNIDLRVTHPWPALPQLTQDGGKLRQILTNLLSNAIKFTPEGGRVRVSSRRVDPDSEDVNRRISVDRRTDPSAPLIEISVEDTGIGIPLQQQEHIFEKFRQGDTSPGERDHTTREYGGTGLGLSIVRELSRLLGGDVQLESEFGKGSVFTVTLPVDVPPIPEQEPEPVLDGPSAVLNRITSVDLMTPAAETLKATPPADETEARP